MAESSLLQALEIFARGAHRVAITDQTGQVQGVLSQSAAIRYLSQQIGRYPSLDACLARTLADHNIHTGEVVSIEESDTVLDALSKMSKYLPFFFY